MEYEPDNILIADGFYVNTATAVADMDANDTAFLQIIISGGTNQADVISNSNFSGALLN